jgi:hypothetical protein
VDATSDWELPTAELEACWRAMETVGKNADSIVSTNVPQFFAIIGINISPHLVDALVAEHFGGVAGAEQVIDFDGLMDMYTTWRQCNSLKSRSATDWITDPGVLKSTSRELLVNDSWPRVCWNMLLMCCAMAHWVIVMYRDGTDGIARDADVGFAVVDFVLSAFYIADMALWARTVIRDGTTITDDPELVPRLYATSPYFAVDVASMLPLDAVLALAGAPVASGVLSHLRLLKAPRTLTFNVVTKDVPLTAAYVGFFFRSLPLWVLFYVLFAATNSFTAVFLAIHNNEDTTSAPMSYITGFYYVVQTFSTVGYGDISTRVKGPGEIWFTIILVFLGMLFNSMLIGRLVAVLQMGNADTKQEDMLRETLAVLKYFSIPDILQVEILSFQEHVLWTDITNAFYMETSVLPQSMRDAMILQTRKDVLMQVKEFRTASDAVLLEMSCALVSSYFKPEQYASLFGDAHFGVRFLLFGFLARFDARGRFVATLRSGDFFGLDGVTTMEAEQFSHKALSYCDMLTLPAMSLLNVLSRYPQFHDAFQQNLLAVSELSDAAATASWNELKRVMDVNQLQQNTVVDLRHQVKSLRRKLEQIVSAPSPGGVTTIPVFVASAAAARPATTTPPVVQ